jgi:hypothetical protein
LNTHSIFELSRISGSSKYNADNYQSVLISEGDNSTGLRIGTPAVVLKHTFEEIGRNDKIKMLFPFPSVNVGMHPNYTCTIKRRHLIEHKGNIFSNHIIRNLQQLHLNDGLPDGAMQGDWKAIKRYVNTKGPITFRIKSHSNNLTALSTLRFLKDLKTLVDSYKYHSVTFHNSSNSYKNPGAMVYLVTFLGIKDCIPIFNPKRVDGVCVILTFISKTKITNTLNPIANTTLLLSNYQDNAFVIDGTWVSTPEALNPDTLGRLAKLVTLNMTAKPKTKLSRAKKKLNTPSKYGKMVAISGSTTVNHVYYSSDSTDTYYSS